MTAEESTSLYGISWVNISHNTTPNDLQTTSTACQSHGSTFPTTPRQTTYRPPAKLVNQSVFIVNTLAAFNTTQSTSCHAGQHNKYRHGMQDSTTSTGTACRTAQQVLARHAGQHNKYRHGMQARYINWV